MALKDWEDLNQKSKDFFAEQVKQWQVHKNAQNEIVQRLQDALDVDAVDISEILEEGVYAHRPPNGDELIDLYEGIMDYSGS